MQTDRVSKIKVGDKEYELILTTKATKEIARRYGGLGQARVFRKLILRPASFFSICGYGCKNIFHYTHPFACIFRKLYFDESLQFNRLCRIILTIYTTKDRRA